MPIWCDNLEEQFWEELNIFIDFVHQRNSDLDLNDARIDYETQNQKRVEKRIMEAFECDLDLVCEKCEYRRE